MKKRVFAVLMVLALMIQAFSFTAFAEGITGTVSIVYDDPDEPTAVESVSFEADGLTASKDFSLRAYLDDAAGSSDAAIEYLNQYTADSAGSYDGSFLPKTDLEAGDVVSVFANNVLLGSATVEFYDPTDPTEEDIAIAATLDVATQKADIEVSGLDASCKYELRVAYKASATAVPAELVGLVNLDPVDGKIVQSFTFTANGRPYGNLCPVWSNGAVLVITVNSSSTATATKDVEITGITKAVTSPEQIVIDTKMLQIKVKTTGEFKYTLAGSVDPEKSTTSVTSSNVNVLTVAYNATGNTIKYSAKAIGTVMVTIKVYPGTSDEVAANKQVRVVS